MWEFETMIRKHINHANQYPWHLMRPDFGKRYCEMMTCEPEREAEGGSPLVRLDASRPDSGTSIRSMKDCLVKLTE